MKKFARFMTLALASALVLSGCSNSSPAGSTDADAASNDNSQTDTAEKIVVGCSPQNMSNENVVRWVNAAQERADEYGNVEFIVNDGEGKPEKQVAQVDQFIAQGVDVIMLCPQDSDQLVPSVQEAIEKGIPVVVIGAALNEDVGNSFVGSPDPVAGEMQMRAVAEDLGGKGKIAVLRGPLGSSPEIQRFEGYQKVLDEYPDIEIVFDQSGEWDRGKGMELMENLLQSGKEVDYVVAQNDEMALGALKTIEDAGLADQIKVSGIDAIPDALNAVKEGRLAFTLLQNTEAQGRRALEKCYEVVVEGAEPSEEMIPFEMVNADNIDDYL